MGFIGQSMVIWMWLKHLIKFDGSFSFGDLKQTF